MDWVEVEAKTVDLAVSEGMKELGITEREHAEVEVVQEPESSLLSKIGLGGKPARVIVRKKPQRKRNRNRNRKRGNENKKGSQGNSGAQQRSKTGSKPNNGGRNRSERPKEGAGSGWPPSSAASNGAIRNANRKRPKWKTRRSS